jgi:N-acetyltransferase
LTLAHHANGTGPAPRFSLAHPSKVTMPAARKRSSCERRRSSSSKTSAFGGGVKHAIKKPSKKRLSIEKEKRDKTTKVAAAKMIAARRRQSASAVASAPATSAALRNLQQQTVRAGSLTPSVNYVLKNGQYQFTRKSPRKHNDSSVYDSPVANRRTPARLFTPSGAGDYLSPSPNNSPVGVRRKLIPSPVKFDREKEEGDMEKDVSGILDALDEDVVEKESEYKVVVADDDISQMAWEAAQEIEELKYEDSDEEDEENKENKGNTTEEEKDDGVFPIFKRNSARSGIAPASSSSTPTKKSAPSSSATRATAALSDRGQMLIDAGQKVICGSQNCESCGFLYNKGNADEAKLHDNHHKNYLGIVSFAGWKSERLAREDEAGEWRVIVVKHGDPKRHWDKANDVLQIVDSALGITTSIRQPKKTEVFLMVKEKRVIAFLLAEPLLDTDKLEKSFLSGETRVVAESSKKVKREALVGVSRIWVHQEFHRMGFASELVDGLRLKYRFPQSVTKTELAFSHTTEMGAKFAAGYVGKKEFLVYRPDDN